MSVDCSRSSALLLWPVCGVCCFWLVHVQLSGEWALYYELFQLKVLPTLDKDCKHTRRL